MRWSIFIFLIFAYSCSHLDKKHDGPDRVPSSEAELVRFGDHDVIQSSVKEFPPQYFDKSTRHFFFVELRDLTSFYVDRDLYDFEVRMKNKKIPVKVERVLRGRYYVIFDEENHLETSQLDFYVGGIKLRENFKLGFKPAHESHTKMRLIKARSSIAKVELVLKDKNGQFVEAPTPPDIITESDGSIEKVEHIGNGIWHITLTYPMGNQLFYLSVRSHGVFFKNLFRFHYVDKQAR